MIKVYSVVAAKVSQTDSLTDTIDTSKHLMPYLVATISVLRWHSLAISC